MARNVGDRVEEFFGNFSGVITEVHDVPGEPDLVEYSIVWDDGEYDGETWSEQDLAPLPEVIEENDEDEEVEV